jgi:hypothetical protein
LLDRVHALEVMARTADPRFEHEGANGVELEQDLFEPELIDLVDDDEEQLVMCRRI